jgi:hypothetical protein
MGARRRDEEDRLIRTVLGIDLASAKWSSVGSATIDFDDELNTFTRVVAGAIAWPTGPLTPDALADAIDAFARREGVRAVALDGPQGWRDPATPEGTRGVGRRCEYQCRTQGKTGAYPRTYPGTQGTWIEFCVDVFAKLLARPGVVLADPGAAPSASTRYVLLECFPTSAWRSSGLDPLPAKGKRPDLAHYLRSLTRAYRLPPTSVSTHDDLQGVVAALAAAAAVGGPAVAAPQGTAGGVIPHQAATRLRIEGYIWDVKPLDVRARKPLAPPNTALPILRAPGRRRSRRARRRPIRC